MEAVRQLGQYPDQYDKAEQGLYVRVRKARVARLFQPADEAELQELQWQAQREKQKATQREKQEANLQVAARVAEADTYLKAMQDKYPAPKFGDPLYGTIEWLQFLWTERLLESYV